VLNKPLAAKEVSITVRNDTLVSERIVRGVGVDRRRHGKTNAICEKNVLSPLRDVFKTNRRTQREKPTIIPPTPTK
jgi:hypothetical protein